MKSIVVLYHKNCPDGFGGAWTAWRKFGDKAEYVPVSANTLPERLPTGKEVYIIDNSYSRDIMQKLEKSNKSLVVIDHHMSQKDEVSSFPQNVFDVTHSGSVLAWKYFFPKKSVPFLLKYVEDRDLWIHKMPHYQEIRMYIDSFPLSFLEWNKLYKVLETSEGRKNCLKEGGAILRYWDTLVQEAVGNAYLVSFEGHAILAANVGTAKLHSTVGHFLHTKQPPFALTWYEDGKEARVSLRSNDTFDVSKIAKKYGGGGHPRASGFRFPVEKKKPWKIIKNKSQNSPYSY